MEDLSAWEGVDIRGMQFGSFVPAHVTEERKYKKIKQRPYACSCIHCGHWVVFRGGYLIEKRPICKVCQHGKSSE